MLQNTESDADTIFMSDVRELQNGDLGSNPETLVTERSGEKKTQFSPSSSTVHATTRNGRKVKLPHRYTPGTSSNLSYDLGFSEFNQIETLAYHIEYFDHELPKSIE